MTFVQRNIIASLQSKTKPCTKPKKSEQGDILEHPHYQSNLLGYQRFMARREKLLELSGKSK